MKYIIKRREDWSKYCQLELLGLVWQWVKTSAKLKDEGKLLQAD